MTKFENCASAGHRKRETIITNGETDIQIEKRIFIIEKRIFKKRLFQIRERLFRIEEQLFQIEKRLFQIKERLFENEESFKNNCSSILNVRRMDNCMGMFLRLCGLIPKILGVKQTSTDYFFSPSAITVNKSLCAHRSWEDMFFDNTLPERHTCPGAGQSDRWWCWQCLSPPLGTCSSTHEPEHIKIEFVLRNYSWMQRQNWYNDKNLDHKG